jgi:hypothetical protein
MIALLCDAGPDGAGNHRKTTVFIDECGHIHDARIGWPEPGENGFTWGPTIGVTPEEHVFQVNLATGTGA